MKLIYKRVIFIILLFTFILFSCVSYLEYTQSSCEKKYYNEYLDCKLSVGGPQGNPGDLRMCAECKEACTNACYE